jgi:broad specificity phosphatase PhoE
VHDEETQLVLLIRHARSLANDDVTLYRRMADHAIPLVQPADDPQALAAGRAMARLGLAPASVSSWCSTYLRCAQTEALVLAEAFGDAAHAVRRRTSFLLREQEFGDWDSLSDAEMAAADPVRYEQRRLLSDAYGRFYFRYPMGESRADVTQRVTLFIGEIHRSNVPVHVVFLHGVTQRAFRMAWLGRSVEWFEMEPNPPNGSLLAIARDPATGQWGDRYL